jgi:uncharacterized damage-inducible protein DinB
MHTLLRDLYSHQAWADAEHWRAFEAHPGALDDPALRERLHHLHLVQRAFLALAQGETPRRRKLDEYAGMAELRDEARAYHAQVAAWLAGADDAGLARAITVPWFKDPPCTLPLHEALTQAVMHSHYHRAQNATRLRELGGAPPYTDYIVWLWRGRPAPNWP